MRRRVAIAATLGALAGALPLFGDENLKPPPETNNTQQVDFAPGGTIRISGSYGDLYIEGWDQPRVEVAVRKLLGFDYEASPQPEREARQLEAVRVVTEPGGNTLTISTVLPTRKRFSPPLPRKTTGGVSIEYTIRVPRNSRLEIHHAVGLVSVSDVTGDIDAACHRGDILLWLDPEGKYAIDARNKFGKVYSDFAGASLSQYLVGQKFSITSATPAQRLRLRMGFGGITLKPILPESEGKNPLAASAKQVPTGPGR